MGSGGPRGRLRGELAEFVGRRAKLALVRQALGTARLVTLTGPGEVGKTRLAIEAAASARRAFGGGVWLAELGGLRDAAVLVPEVARSLGLCDRPARWAVAALSDYLAGRQVLLVLDQCEHLADACAVMADALLRACPALRIMATSRHVLGVAGGEVTLAVPPMTVPDDCLPGAAEDLQRYEAVRLFTDRAEAVVPGFALDSAGGAAVAGICRRLDRIPLAIELAAVRRRSLSPGEILSRLDSRFPLLSRGRSGGPAAPPDPAGRARVELRPSRRPARTWSATSTTSRSSRWPAWWPCSARCRTGAARRLIVRSAGPMTGTDPKGI